MGKVRVWHGEEKTKKPQNPQEKKTTQQKDADSFLSGHKVRIHFLMSDMIPWKAFLFTSASFNLF